MWAYNYWSRLFALINQKPVRCYQPQLAPQESINNKIDQNFTSFPCPLGRGSATPDSNSEDLVSVYNCQTVNYACKSL